MLQDKIYVLCYPYQDQTRIFYVGRTNDQKRRLTEHRADAKNLQCQEYKYQWCRDIGDIWSMEIVAPVTADYDEYSAILDFARHNQQQGITYIDGLPLTNMRAGDFWTEIVADTAIKTINHRGYQRYQQQRELERRQIQYQREHAFGNQSGSMFHRLFTPDRLEDMKIKKRSRAPQKGYDWSLARAEWLKQQTQDMIDRDRSEGRTLPGGVSDE